MKGASEGGAKDASTMWGHAQEESYCRCEDTQGNEKVWETDELRGNVSRLGDASAAIIQKHIHAHQKTNTLNAE